MYDQKEKNRVSALIKSLKGGEKELERVQAMILSRDGGASDPVIIDDWISNALVVCYRNIQAEAQHVTDDAIANALMKAIWREAFKLSSITPSEAAILYQESCGEFPVHSSAKEIFRQKTCADLPKQFIPENEDEESSAILRAIMLRDTVTKLFRAKYSHLGLKPSAEATDALIEFAKNPPSDMPWARPSFGFDVFEAPTKELYLVNYKCPVRKETADDYSKEIPTSENASFAYMEMILNKCGINVSRSMVAVLDPYMSLKMFEVKTDSATIDAVRDACSKFWSDSVKAGMSPKREPSKNFKSVKDVPIDLHEKTLRLAAASALKNKAEALIKGLKREILSGLNKNGVSLDELMDYDKNSTKLSSKVQVSSVTVSQTSTPKLKMSELKQAYIDRGGDVEKIRSESIDDTKLIDQCKSIGIDLSDYTEQTVSHRFNVIKSATHQMAPIVKEVQQLAEETLDDVSDEISSLVLDHFGSKPERKSPELIGQTPKDWAFNEVTESARKQVELDVPL